MKASSLLASRFWRVLLAAALLASLAPFAAAQQSQNPPAKPKKSTPPTVEQMKEASSPDSLGEDENDLRKRAEWFYRQRTYPLGFVPPNARLNSLKELDAMIEAEIKSGLRPPQEAVKPVPESVEPRIGFPFSSTGASIGPASENNAFNNTFFGTPTDSGRVSAIAVDPTNSSIVYVGGANGGIWKSTDAGAHFTPMTDNQASLAIGSIALAPSSPTTIYVGTGEQDFVSVTPTTGGENYYGAGILKSTDGGMTWTNIQGPFAGPLTNLVGGARLPAIAVHPTNANIVLVGAVFANSGGADAGIYRSTDGGATWSQVATASGAIGTAVVFDPSNGNNVYAALGRTNGSASNGVYKSTDGGATFTKLGGGLPTSNVGRIELAIAASSPTTLYASIANSSGGSTRLLGLWKSTDGGTTWTQVVNGATFDYCGGQCFYSHAIAVSPVNASFVLAGGTAGQGAGTSIGQTLFRSTDGGMTWTDIHVGASTTRLHSDQHAFKFSSDGTRAYVGNDGGVWRSDNITAAPGTLDWTNVNGTLTLAEPYPGFAVDENNPNRAFGGTQDNGTIMFSGNAVWDQIACGDGAANLVDRKVPSTVYVMCTSGNSPYIQRSLTGGGVGTFTRIESGIAPGDRGRTEFIPFIAMDRSNTNILYTPTFRVYRSTDWGTTWTAISPDLTANGASSVAVVAVAGSNSNVVYAATDDARVSRTTNALSANPAWTNLNTVDLPNRFFTSIAIDGSDPNGNIAYLGASGFKFGADTKGHVFKTMNGGTSWTDISGNLPNTPVNAIALDSTSGTIFVGTDIGIFKSTDGGTTWTTFGTALPRVAVLSLAGTGAVGFAATHGRGVFAIDIFGAIPAGPQLAAISPSFSAAGAPTVTLTADGANFTANSKVEWDHSQNLVTTTFVSANQLTATIDTSLLTTGVHDVTVFDATQTPMESSRLRFAVTGGAPTLTSINPTAVAPGGPAFPLTATGTGFVCSGTAPTVVDFGGDLLTPTTCSATSMQVTVPASETTTPRSVLVRAFTTPPGGGPSGALAFVVGTPPTNDNFANAMNIASLPFTDTENTVAATTEAGEPAPAPACTLGAPPSVNTKSIWYKITPSMNESVTFTTQGENTFGILQVVTGTLGSFTAVPAGCNAGRLDDPTTAVTVNLTAGTTYFIMYSDFTGNGGTGVLNASLATPPPNDNFANAINVSAVPFTNTQSSLSATTEAGEPVPDPGTCTVGQSPNTRSIWFKYVPSASGNANFTTNGSATDTIIQVVTGSLGSFTAVPSGCADQQPAGVGETVTVAVTSGTTYFIMISDFAGGGGTTVFNFVSGPPPQGGGGTGTLSFNPLGPVDFGNQVVNTTSAPMQSVLTNAGPGSVTITNIQGSGTNPNDFAQATPLQAGDCNVSVVLTGSGAGSSCNLRGIFTPSGTGLRTSTITVTASNSTNSPSLNVQGTGTNPVPAITTLSPSPATAGAAFTLTVNGTNFVTNSVVNVNGNARTTTFVSSTQLTATIPASDVPSAAAVVNVTVVNPAPGGGTSNQVNLPLVNAAPTISGLNPSTVAAMSGQFTLTVNGTGYVSTSVVTFNGANETTTFVSSTQVTAVIPNSAIGTAGNFNVTVVNPAPGGGTSTAIVFIVTSQPNPVPTLASLSPSPATAGAAFTLTANGTNFVANSVVNVNGNARTTTFVSATQLTAAIPATDVPNATAVVNITVFNPAPGGGTSNPPVNLPLVNPAPAITSLSPNNTLVGGPAFNLTVNGSGFVSNSQVSFNSAAVTTTFVSGTQLTAAIPASAIANAGAFNVTVTNAAPGGGTSAPATFTVNNPAPVLTSIQPTTAAAGSGAFILTANGSSFVASSGVTFNGAAVTTTFVSATQLTAAIPASAIAATGNFPVTVVTPGPGGGTSAPQTFTVTGPTITSLSPSSAAAGGTGFNLTVNGTNYANGATVTWNGSDRVTTFGSASQLTAAILASDLAVPAGTATVQVRNPGGVLSNTSNFTISGPTITSLSPSSSGVGGPGFTLTVTGTNFVAGSVVSFGGNARVTTFGSGTSLTAAILASDIAAVGTPAVKVTNPGTATSNSVNFTVGSPTITPPLSPASVLAGSGAFTLTVTGTNFVNGSTVNFNGNARATAFVSSTSLTAAILAGDVATAGSFPVVVQNPGAPSNAVNFAVNNPVPTATSLLPSSVVAGSGAFTLTVTGTNFVANSVVNFNGNAKTTTFVSATSLTAAIPASDVVTGGTFNVTVTNPVPGGGTSNPQTFTVNNPVPTLTSLSPTMAPAGAAFTLTVTGTKFVATSVVNFNGNAKTTTFVSATSLTAAISAADVATGGTPSVTVTNPAPGGGTSSSQSFTVTDFTVSGPAGAVTVTAGTAATFTITVAPTAAGAFPNAVTFSASGLPAAASPTFNPASVTPGASPQTSTLTITTTARTAVPPRGPAPPLGPRRLPVVLWTLTALLALASWTLLRRGLRTRRWAVYLPLALLALGLAGVMGCSGTKMANGTPAGTSTITVTATSGSAVHTTTVMLTVN